MSTKTDKIIEETKNQIRKLIIGFVQGKTVDTEYIDNLILRLNSDFEQAIKELEQEKDKEIEELKDRIESLKLDLTDNITIMEFKQEIKELKTKLKEKDDGYKKTSKK